MLHAGELVSKADLTEHIYQQDFDRDSNVLEVFIGRLRRKLDPDKRAQADRDRARPRLPLRHPAHRRPTDERRRHRRSTGRVASPAVAAGALADRRRLRAGGVPRACGLTRSTRRSTSAAESALRDRLQSYAYAYLAGSDVDARRARCCRRTSGRIRVSTDPCQRAVRRHGRSARSTASTEQLASPSAIGRDFRSLTAAGARRRASSSARSIRASGATVLVQLRRGLDDGRRASSALHLTFHVAEDSHRWARRRDVFRRTLLIWLGAASACAVVLLLRALRWSLRPLRRVASDLSAGRTRRAASISQPLSARTVAA